MDNAVLNARTLKIEPKCDPHPNCSHPQACTFPCRWPECIDLTKYETELPHEVHSE